MLPLACCPWLVGMLFQQRLNSVGRLFQSLLYGIVPLLLQLLLAVIVFGFLYAELFIEPVIVQRQSHLLHALHDVEQRLRLRLLVADIGKLAALHIESEVGEDRLHVIVEDVKQEVAVIGVHVVLFLLVHCAERLCAFALGIGGKRVAQQSFTQRRKYGKKCCEIGVQCLGTYAYTVPLNFAALFQALIATGRNHEL